MSFSVRAHMGVSISIVRGLIKSLSNFKNMGFDKRTRSIYVKIIINNINGHIQRYVSEWRSNKNLLEMFNYVMSNLLYSKITKKKQRMKKEKPSMCSVGETLSGDLVGSRHGPCNLRIMLQFTESAPFVFLSNIIISESTL